MKNKISVAIVGLLAIGLLAGCTTKSKKNNVDATQTSGFDDQEGFGNYGFSTANRMKAPHNQSYYFDFDNYDVKSEDAESIRVQADYAIVNPSARLRIEGNADERGSREYNVTLGWKRAKAVANILKQHGVSSAQIATISYGKEKPLALGHDEESHSQNRRVDLIYESK
jgi:peptidoglycan-associated lipoprotein